MKSRLGTIENGSVESVIADRLTNVGTRLQGQMREAEAYIRREPRKAMLYAVLTGYVARALPVTLIATALVRAVFAALKPAALLFGAVKIWDLLHMAPSPKRREQAAAN